MIRTRGLLLPILSGLLLAVSFPPFHLLVPPFVALVPFALYLRVLPHGAEGSREAFRAGSVMGSVYFGLLLAWLIPALAWLTPLGPLLYLVIVLLLAAVPGAVGWTVHRLEGGAGVPVVLVLPVAWTAGEWLRGNLPGGLAFPWLGLGTSLTVRPELVGFAELFGARGVTFWLVLVNALVAELVARYLERGRDAPGRSGPSGAVVLGVLAVMLLGPVGWGVWRARTLPTSPVGRLALVRTEIPAGVKEDPGRALDRTRSQLRELGFGEGAATVGDTLPGPDLVVWPETTFPFPVPASPGGSDGDRDPGIAGPGLEALRFVRSASAEVGAPILFGALDTLSATAPGGPAEYNAAFLVDSRDGGDAASRVPPLSPPDTDSSREATSTSTAPVVYRKRFLVPLAERSPRLVPSLPVARPFLQGPAADGSRDGSLSAGRSGEPVDLPNTVGPEGDPGSGSGRFEEGGGLRFGILICFESGFPAASRGYRDQGADFLVNMTSDIWFGDGGGALAVAGARQHAAHVVMRAVENRMGVARSANGGGTFFVDPVGRVRGAVSGRTAGVTVGELRTSTVRTLYSRTGDLVGPASAVAVALLVVMVGWRGCRRRN